MSCPSGAGQARAQDSCRFRVSYDLLLGAANAPLFYFPPGRTHTTHPRYYVTANQSERGVFGIRRPLVGGHCRVCRGLHKDGGHGPEIW